MPARTGDCRLGLPGHWLGTERVAAPGKPGTAPHQVQRHLQLSGRQKQLLPAGRQGRATAGAGAGRVTAPGPAPPPTARPGGIPGHIQLGEVQVALQQKAPARHLLRRAGEPWQMAGKPCGQGGGPAANSLSLAAAGRGSLVPVAMKATAPSPTSLAS